MSVINEAGQIVLTFLMQLYVTCTSEDYEEINRAMAQLTKFDGHLSFENIVFRCSYSEKYCQENREFNVKSMSSKIKRHVHATQDFSHILNVFLAGVLMITHLQERDLYCRS